MGDSSEPSGGQKRGKGLWSSASLSSPQTPARFALPTDMSSPSLPPPPPTPLQNLVPGWAMFLCVASCKLFCHLLTYLFTYWFFYLLLCINVVNLLSIKKKKKSNVTTANLLLAAHLNIRAWDQSQWTVFFNVIWNLKKDERKILKTSLVHSYVLWEHHTNIRRVWKSAKASAELVWENEVL